jgi:hypothetical protein
MATGSGGGGGGAAAASAAYGIISDIWAAESQARVSNAQTDASRLISEGNNKVVAASNARDKVLSNTARWRQSIHNSRVFEAIGNNQEASEVNYQRQIDLRGKANFSDQIKAAEASGRAQASAAASGISGSVVDVIDSTMKMRRGIEDTSFRETNRLMASDQRRQQFASRWATMDQMDRSLILDDPQGLDFAQTAPQSFSPWSTTSVKDLMTLGSAIADFKFSTPEFSGIGWGTTDVAELPRGSYN